MDRKKVLVVGGAGYIGGLTTDCLIDHGHDVTVFDNLLYEERYFKPVKFVYGDIRDTDTVVKLANNFDVVVWMAALVGDPACEVDKNVTNDVNHLAVKNFCKELNPDVKMIFFSTCSVYGLGDGLLDEESPTNPLSAYASTKLAAEQYVAQRNGCIFRLGTVYGLGDNFARLRLDLVVNVMATKAFMDHKITVNGGEQWRPIISTSDIAQYVLHCVEDFHPGIYALSSENVIIKDLGERISRMIPYTHVDYVDVPFQDQRNYRVDASKAEKTFGYKCQVTVEDEVKNIYKVLSEHRVKDLTNITYNNGQFLKSNQQVAKI